MQKPTCAFENTVLKSNPRQERLPCECNSAEASVSPSSLSFGLKVYLRDMSNCTPHS